MLGEKKLTMHFLPRWLKRHSFSCGVSSIEPTFACRRCGGCPLIISDQFIKYAPTVNRYKGSKKIHKQSLGHPWPSSDPLTPARFVPGVRTTAVPRNVRRLGMQRDLPLLFKIRSKLQRPSEDGKRWKLSWEVRPPESPEPVPSNMAVLGRVHYLGMGSTLFPAASRMIAKRQFRRGKRRQVYIKSVLMCRCVLVKSPVWKRCLIKSRVSARSPWRWFGPVRPWLLWQECVRVQNGRR